MRQSLLAPLHTRAELDDLLSPVAGLPQRCERREAAIFLPTVLLHLDRAEDGYAVRLRDTQGGFRVPLDSNVRPSLVS